MASLAKTHGRRIIGIILSGTGFDGTMGIKAIKAAGGITFAQDEKTAKYYGMPSSAIASGSVDFVLSPGAIAGKLTGIASHEQEPALKRPPARLNKEEAFNKILILLKDISGIDFLHYKRATLERRIIRRMSLHKIEFYKEYYNYLLKSPKESGILYKDILIPVTTFFRDPEIFTALRKKIFPHLLKGRRRQNHIRVWVPACSTGEEVYSIAIVIYEFLEDNKVNPHFQIFGTDLSEANINKARLAVFTKENVSGHISAPRLRRFFTKTEKGYKIVKQIRDLCVFARQDVTNDPPLSNMDLVSCRNLLIYLDTFLQEKVLSTLYYALKPRGFLVLGTSESVTSLKDLFIIGSKKYKIYSKNASGRERPVSFAPQVKFKLMPETSHASMRRAAPPREAKPGVEKSERGKPSYAKLERELAQTKKRLNEIAEDKDTFNEELKSANEEIQSSNEELQSTNEELETSKEELQSGNEELLTVNDELQTKNSELHELNSDLANILTSVNIPLIIVKNDLRIMRFTPMARKVMNLIPTDLGRPIGDIKLNINIPDLEKTIFEVIENNAPLESEVKDSDGRRYSMRVRPYKTLDNKIEGAVISLIDINDIKQAQDALKDALDYADSVIETVREPLIIMNKDLRVLSANKSFYETFVATAQNIENKPISRILGHKLDIEELQKLLKKILPRKTYFDNFEMAFKLPGTGERTISINARQIYLRGKEKQMILMSLEDITDRKRAEDILKSDKVKTQKLIDLQNKLEISKRLSDIGTLAATVAHELRNPLAAIGLAVHSINKKSHNQSLEKYTGLIGKKVDESDQIINNLLFYSRIKPPSYESVSISGIVKECVDIVKTRYKKEFSVISKLAPVGKFLIEADATQIREIVNNILNNACDAVLPEKGKVEITCVFEDKFLRLVFKDNGPGIDQESLAKVFDPFFTTKAKGTGLGLSVCRQILHLHGGSIDLQSEPGKGTAVIVRLPVRKTDVR